MATEYSHFRVDPQRAPVPPERIAELLAEGMPADAVREDGTLDVAVLRAHGWDISGSWIMHDRPEGAAS